MPSMRLSDIPGGVPAMPAEPTAVLDVQAFERLRELDPTGKNQLVERVLSTFQTSAARLGPELAEARLSGDWTAVRRIAHTFKSSAAIIGAMTMARFSARVETAISPDQRPGSAVSADLHTDLDAMTSALAMTLRAIELRQGVLP